MLLLEDLVIVLETFQKHQWKSANNVQRETEAAFASASHRSNFSAPSSGDSRILTKVFCLLLQPRFREVSQVAAKQKKIQ